MVIRFVGKLAELVAIFRHHSEENKPVIVEDKPELNEYEKLWNRTRELAKFNPVYLERGDVIYQVIDELTCVEVCIKTGRRGIMRTYTPSRHPLFDIIANQTLEQNGYSEISAREFHHEFTKIANETNLTVNQALKPSIS